jgi:hypothetical protein
MDMQKKFSPYSKRRPTRKYERHRRGRVDMLYFSRLGMTGFDGEGWSWTASRAGFSTR